MPLIWCSISGHGFGHAAQMVPVLNDLGRLAPGVKVVLRTTVPRWFFQDRLEGVWELSEVQQDIGCVQRGPLLIDVAATWSEHQRFHADWERTVENEVRAIRARSPDLLVSDISYLAIEAGARAQVPAVGLCNLSWDLVLDLLLDQGKAAAREEKTERTGLIDRMRVSYGLADLLIRPAPGLPMYAFRKIADVGPIATPLANQSQRLRDLLGAETDERVVLIGFGGIALDSLPFDRLDAMSGFRFVVSGPVPVGCRRIHPAASVALPFGSLLASADILVTKPGYSTIVEAVALSKPVVYVRRYNFADEQCLVDYLHRFGRGVKLSAETFAAGNWQKALDAVWTSPKPAFAPPPPSGAAEAATVLVDYLQG